MPVAMARHILVKTEAEAAALKQRIAAGEAFDVLAKKCKTGSDQRFCVNVHLSQLPCAAVRTRLTIYIRSHHSHKLPLTLLPRPSSVLRRQPEARHQPQQSTA